MTGLGTDFPNDDFLPSANNIQVDLDPARLGRRAPVVQGIAADVGRTITALLELLEQADPPGVPRSPRAPDSSLSG